MLASFVGQTLGSAVWGVAGALGGAAAGFTLTAALAFRHGGGGAADPHRIGVPDGAGLPRSAFWSYALNAWGAAVISAVTWGRTELLFLERLSTHAEAGYFPAALVFSSLSV
ncbi:hypothetical protein MAX20_28485, partial [Escherichia coli]